MSHASVLVRALSQLRHSSRPLPGTLHWPDWHGYVPQQAVIMAGRLIGSIPVLIVFAILGRQIVGGIMQGAIKG